MAQGSLFDSVSADVRVRVCLSEGRVEWASSDGPPCWPWARRDAENSAMYSSQCASENVHLKYYTTRIKKVETREKKRNGRENRYK